MVPLDATLGVPGLPQSATGQTSLLTGVNAQALLGKHLNGFPNAKLQEVIGGHGPLRRASSFGKTAFENAYAPRFFIPRERLPKRERPRHSVTTVAARTADIPLKTLEDLRAGGAVFHDFTNRVLTEHGHEAPMLEPFEAGGRLARIAADHHLLLYEHFLTDIAGHTADVEQGLVRVSLLDGFLTGVLETIDLKSQTVLMTSDHGNLEDYATRSHTRNPVPAFLWGSGAGTLARGLQTIADVTPAVLRWLGG